jgi:CBS domain containing-hemolysin-like protein
VPVEEINTKLNIQIPEKKDYTTLSGMFIYHFGKFPHEGSTLTVGDIHMTVNRMGKRKIDEILMILDNR